MNLILRVSKERCVRDQDLVHGWALLGGLSQHPVQAQIPVVDVLAHDLGIFTGDLGQEPLKLVVSNVDNVDF